VLFVKNITLKIPLKAFILSPLQRCFSALSQPARNRNSLAVLSLRMLCWSSVCILSSADRFLVLMWLVWYTAVIFTADSKHLFQKSLDSGYRSSGIL